MTALIMFLSFPVLFGLALGFGFAIYQAFQPVDMVSHEWMVNSDGDMLRDILERRGVVVYGMARIGGVWHVNTPEGVKTYQELVWAASPDVTRRDAWVEPRLGDFVQ